MLLQYVAVSFHLPSVSTANINTVQYPKPHQQYATPSIPSLAISKVLLPQSNIMAAFVHRLSSLLSDDCPGLPTNIISHILQCIFMVTSCSLAQVFAHCIQILKYKITFYFLTFRIQQLFRKKAYNETLHQLLIEFEIAYDSVNWRSGIT